MCSSEKIDEFRGNIIAVGEPLGDFTKFRGNSDELAFSVGIPSEFPRMSAIDFYCSVDKVKGVDGNNRVVVTLDGKYLSHSEQRTENMVSRLNLKGIEYQEDAALVGWTTTHIDSSKGNLALAVDDDGLCTEKMIHFSCRYVKDVDKYFTDAVKVVTDA
ncbi:hypothetical protein F2Q69_00053656 [Brassica cretica]|uniref:Cyanate lyase C-terminal domain-containing protein n=1 Tax=Brassica cretica TaxID=69181 RepID=A0A8S9MZ09_BRACR|nr:hypothetical protein F2Q69_00053656 [Brassica cretica]